MNSFQEVFKFFNHKSTEKENCFLSYRKALVYIHAARGICGVDYKSRVTGASKAKNQETSIIEWFQFWNSNKNIKASDVGFFSNWHLESIIRLQ